MAAVSPLRIASLACALGAMLLLELREAAGIGLWLAAVALWEASSGRQRRVEPRVEPRDPRTGYSPRKACPRGCDGGMVLHVDDSGWPPVATYRCRDCDLRESVGC